MALGMLFPGQGSQAVGMLAALAAAQPEVTETFAEASAVVGYDLWQQVQEGPEEALNRTEVTQPAMLAAGVASWRVWQARGGATPSVMAGHSLGEYSALVCAGALTFADAVALVASRGRLMQQAVPAGSGAMAALVGLTDEQVAEACRAAEVQGDELVAPVNFNAPGQVVIAGSRTAVERAISAAKGLGAKMARLLPVSVPSHCDLMRPAAEALAQQLASVSIQPPQIAVINNVDVATVHAPEAIRDALVRQLYSPVRWVETVTTMAQQGVTTLLECGPGKVLVGLNKRINKQLQTLPLLDSETIESALAATGVSDESNR